MRQHLLELAAGQHEPVCAAGHRDAELAPVAHRVDEDRRDRALAVGHQADALDADFRAVIEEVGDDVAVDDYENGLTTSAIIGPKGGKLKIKDKGPKKDEDGSKLHAALSVELKIPKDALDVEEEISMRVSGYFLSELIIAFAPGGLDFAEDARLKIRLERDRVDLDAATLYGVHTTHTGETEVVLVEVEAKGSGDVILNVRVPGFSRYSLGE